MMPLCTTETPRLTCGWALFSEGTPWVAQRVCAMPRFPDKPCSSASLASSATLPVLRSRLSVPFTTATPAES